MKLSQLISTMRLPEGVVDIDITGLTADSRKVKPGMMFAAIPGRAADGRDYIAKAIENGAAAILSTPGLGAGLVGKDMPYIAVQNPRETYAFLASRLYAGQPDTIVAVTGTNGKSSTVEFLRQIWGYAGEKAACFGTLGVSTQGGTTPLTHTTPDATALHQTLQDLNISGITHCGMEASSHGLDQNRLDAVRLSVVGFTNLTQDHFDYHGTAENYFQAKARLFTELAPRGIPAIINIDDKYGQRLAALAKERGLNVITTGYDAAANLQIRSAVPNGHGQALNLVWQDKIYAVDLPLAGNYQAQNAASAAAMAIATSIEPKTVFQALGQLKGVTGRMEKVGQTEAGAPIYVDFAHTPDGLKSVLKSLQPHVSGRLVLVFGCGGDRDSDKREKMGLIAAIHADEVIVTDDNPRSEIPASIRAAVLKGCPDAAEIGDRRSAIAKGIELLRAGDALIIAGKGHESGQIVGNKILPFRDADVASEELAAISARSLTKGRSQYLWTAPELSQATNGVVVGDWDGITGLSIDTRSIEEGELFIPLKDQRDGHDFIPMALEAGAIVLSERRINDVPALRIEDSLEALCNMARHRIKSSSALRIAITGSVGKTSVKEAAALALAASGKTHKSIRSFNNHWGVPLTMALMPQETEFGVFETGMNHAGELSDLSALLRPHIAVITKVAPAHLAHFESVDAIADAKMEIFEALSDDGGAGIGIVNADDPYCGKFIDCLSQYGREAIIVGQTRGNVIYNPVSGGVDINCSDYKGRKGFNGFIALQQKGEHHAFNAALVMAIALAAGADMVKAARALESLMPIAGRGDRSHVTLDGKSLTLIDESYNANPESMRAAIVAAGQAQLSDTLDDAARKVAVLGDMLELGERANDMHIGLAEILQNNGFDHVITVGAHMQALHKALPDHMRGEHVGHTRELIEALQAQAQNGDLVLFKASNSVGLGDVVKTLKDQTLTHNKLK